MRLSTRCGYPCELQTFIDAHLVNLCGVAFFHKYHKKLCILQILTGKNMPVKGILGQIKVCFSFAIDYLKSVVFGFLRVWRPYHSLLAKLYEMYCFLFHSHNKLQSQAVCVYISFGKTCRHCRTNGANNSSNTTFHCTVCLDCETVFAAYILFYSHSLSLPPSFSSPFSLSLCRRHTHT